MHKFLIFLAIISLGFLPVITTAQQSACTDQIAGKSRAQLEQELEACNKEITQWTATLNETKKNSASFTTDIAALTAKINAAQANIKKRNIEIANLTKDIAIKQSEITILDTRITNGKKAIANILRKTNDINSYSLVEAMFSDKNLSEFFVDIDTYASTERALADLFAELRDVKALTEAQKSALNKKREAEAAARVALETSKKEVEVNQAEKKTLLAVSQSKEKTYGQVLADRQAKAAQIRAVLFPLRDAGAIPFGTALQYAEAASAKTGVRSSFILGIFATESGKGSDGTFGGNVGQCLLTNTPNKGDGKGKNTGTFFSQVMKGSRDVDPFMEIVKELGVDPYAQVVSCPQSSGYGGAMGPAQFIPSTWKLMKSSIARATGKSAPDPWNPADAFMASALLLADLGAGKGTYEAERAAACRYNGGGMGCTSRTTGYGNTVMKNAAEIQRDVDFLQGV
ncbi:MAG: lytic murein transglycosylase [bacterium]|nr:lytic murein transglycosylase [bacterium]MDZ4206027.1 lytic murein transglycosylase [Patescibacteria group bacterium]